MALGDYGIDALKTEAIERFSTHIERWLNNTRQDMFGDGTIPYVAAEGNRVVASYRVDPEISGGVGTIEEELGEPPVIEPVAAEAGEGESNVSPTEQNSHRPVNKTAFG
jgi:hypothetical protein